VDRPSAGDLADAFAPGISGARDVVTALCEENDRLKSSHETLQATALRNVEGKIQIMQVLVVKIDLQLKSGDWAHARCELKMELLRMLETLY